MNFIVRMLPVIFILHDFEEIIMAEGWGKRYKERINRLWPNKQPFGLNYMKHRSFYSTVRYSFLSLSAWNYSDGRPYTAIA
jgi:hypothetical protein